MTDAENAEYNRMCLAVLAAEEMVRCANARADAAELKNSGKNMTMIPKVYELCQKLMYVELDPYFRDDEKRLLAMVSEIEKTIREWYVTQRADPESLHSKGLRDPCTPRGRGELG